MIPHHSIGVKRLLLTCSLLLVAIGGLLLSVPQTASAAAGINQTINFQGRLFNSQGAIVPDGYYNMQFKIYQDGTGTAVGNPGGTLKWTESWLNTAGNGVMVKNGYISVSLGSINAFGSQVDWNQDTLWLSMNIGDTVTSCTPFTSCTPDGEMVPMKRLSATPYALNAGKLGGLDASGFIQNTSTQQTANFNISGTGTVGTLQASSVDTAAAGTLTIGNTNATSITLAKDVTVAAGMSLTLAGGTTASRPTSPTEGMMWYDTTTKQLLVYSNGKWQADRNTATKVVAASNASQALKDGADYVATGTNDQTIINNALTAAAGGKVYLTEGTYTIGASISLPLKTQLSGAGSGTLIQLANFGATSTDIDAIAATTVDGTGYVLRDLRIDGRKSVNTAGTQRGIFLNYVARNVPNGATLDNVSVGNFRSQGIQIQESGHITVSNSNIYANGGDGMYINYGSHDFTITNSIFRDNQGKGLTLDGSYGVIDGNSFTSNVGAGIYVHGGDNTVTNNVVSSNGSDGIFVHQSDRNLVTGNTVRSNTGIGIEVADGVDYSAINSNNVYSNSSYGIALTWVSNNNTVSSNEIYNNGGATENGGILLDYSSSNNSITSNKITDSSCTSTCYAILINNSSSANYLADNTLGGGTVNDLGTGTLYGGQSNGTSYLIQPASNITMGSAATVTTLQGNTAVTLNATTGTTIVCQNGTGYLSMCDSSVLTPSAANFIQNGTTLQTSANFWIDGVGKVASGLQSSSLDTITAATLTLGGTNASSVSIGKAGSNTIIQGNLRASNLDTASAGVLTLGGTNATSIALNQNITVAANKSLTLSGGTTASRPVSPTEGMMWYDTSTKQLLTYANGKWQSDRSTASKIVGTSASGGTSGAVASMGYNGADYVNTSTTSAQTVINSALTAVGNAGGGSVYLMEGTYIIDGSISIPNNVTLAGTGAGTIIKFKNAINADFNGITNTDTTNGTNVTIKDLALDGNRANQTSGGQNGIVFDHMGSGSGASARAGGKISNIYARNTFEGSGSNGAIYLISSFNTTVSDNTLTNSWRDIALVNSAYNTITGNVTQGTAGAAAMYIAGSSYNTISGNTFQGAGSTGVYFYSSDKNTVTGNNIYNNTNYGMQITYSASNIVSGNTLGNNGSATTNNAIYVDASSSNTITSNSITDSSATTNNYAINIINSTSNTNYLADNTFSSTPGTSTINDAGTGTVYSNQARAENGAQITNRTANDTQAFTVQNASGLNMFSVDTSNNRVVVGNTSTTGKLALADGAGHTGTLVMGTLGGNYTITVPTVTANDTICLQTLANCGVSGAATTIGALDGGTANANGATISGGTFYLQSASANFAGLVNTGTQTFAGAKTFNDSVTLAAGKTINMTGSTTANRPASPTEGMMYYDTDTKQLLTYSNGKWQSDRNTATKIVAASNASQALKDGADYVATGTGDQGVINSALMAAPGGKVYLTEGTYIINASISIPNNTTLAGAGYGTVITVPNSFNTDINAVTNTTTGGNGTGITIQDLRLDGNKANQTSGFMNAIYFNGVGSGSGSSAIQGGKIANIWANNWYGSTSGGAGITLTSSANNTISGTTTQANVNSGILLGSSGLNTITGNAAHGNSNGILLNNSSSNTLVSNSTVGNGAAGISLNTSLTNTITGNTTQNNAYGMLISTSANNNTVTGNTVRGNGTSGIYLGSNASNTVSANKIYDNGSTPVNNAIYLDNSSSNTITGNNITDTSATTNNYAINISNSTSSANYFADNTLGGGTVNDAGTGTIYGGQSNGTSYLIQPASNITMGSAATTTTIQGTLTITPQTSASTTMLCSNGGIVSTCDSSLLAPTGTNFIRNQTGQQASANFNISGTGIASILQAATFDTSSAATLSIGTTNASSITLGKSGVATTAAGGLLTSSVDAGSITALTIGTTNASSISIGKSSITTNLTSSTINVGASGSTTTIQSATQATAGQAGNNMIIQGSTGNGNGNGGNVTVQGGNMGATGTYGGNLTLAGGTGGTSNGVVILATSAFQTATSDTGCFPSGTESTSTSNCTISQNSVNNNAAVIVGFTNDGQTAFMPDPAMATVAGRVIYVTASGATKDFTLSVNGGGQGNQIAMRKNTTATMIWNGADWTAAGASSSTTLQAAYDNTLQSAGGAELVVSKTTATNGLTIRDSSVNSVNGALLTVQSSSAANLFSVNSNVTEYATDAGAEVYGASTSAFPANTWATIASPASTVTRYTTAGDYIATGQGSVSVVTPATANAGVMNRLSTNLTPNMTYNVSFSTRLSSGTFTDMTVHYSMDGTTTAGSLVACAASQTAKTSIWAKINCTFQAPASGITTSNAILIRQATGVARTFYVDNLSVTIAADFNYAADPGADGTAGFGTVWSAAGTATVTQNLLDGNDASSSAQASTSTANSGVRNRLSINPLVSTLYRVSIYAKLNSGAALNDFRIRYTPNGGTNFVDCVDYSTQALTSSWAQITCYIKTDTTALGTPYVYFLQTTASGTRVFSVDTFSMTLASSTTANVQVGSGSNGGPTTLFTLDKGASAPIAANNDALLGSMYYDTTLGKLQCYEADGWGACGSSPDNIVTISPEYTNAVLHGPSVGTTGVGTMTSDLCSDTLNINDSGTGTTICGTNETYNFYKWTSPQATAQTYGIYVTYQLPTTFKSFASGVTSIMGRTDNGSSGGSASVSYKIYKSTPVGASNPGLTQCGSAVSVSSGTVTSWQTGIAAGAADPSTCGFAPGDSILFEIDMTASRNANAYVGNLGFTFSNK